MARGLAAATSSTDLPLIAYEHRPNLATCSQVSRAEFHEAMGALGLEVPSAEIDALFSEWDRDGGGSLDFPELKKILSQSAPPTPLQQAGNAVKNGQAFIKGAGSKAKVPQT